MIWLLGIHLFSFKSKCNVVLLPYFSTKLNQAEKFPSLVNCRSFGARGLKVVHIVFFIINVGQISLDLVFVLFQLECGN